MVVCVARCIYHYACMCFCVFVRACVFINNRNTANTWCSGYHTILNPNFGVHTGTGMLLFPRYKDKITPTAAVLQQ